MKSMPGFSYFTFLLKPPFFSNFLYLAFLFLVPDMGTVPFFAADLVTLYFTPPTVTLFPFAGIFCALPPVLLELPELSLLLELPPFSPGLPVPELLLPSLPSGLPLPPGLPVLLKK